MFPICADQGLGSIGLNWTSPPQWSPESDGLLVSGGAESEPAWARDLCAAIGRAANCDSLPRCADLSAVDTAAHDRVRPPRSTVAGAFRSHRDAVRTEADRKRRGALCLVVTRRHSALRLRRRIAVALARWRGTEDRLADLLHAAHGRTDADPERSDHRWNRRTDDRSPRHSD